MARRRRHGVTYFGRNDPPAARRLIEAIAIATGHGGGLRFADS
ncbi:hypothetical protein [Actinoplanes hulinensis]|nr:hypothetical protein [Actinoplanes hulinensis]